MTTQNSASSFPNNQQTQHSGFINPQVPGPPNLRNRVTEVHSATANGCLSEVGYQPGLSMKVGDLEARLVKKEKDCAKLLDDNIRLARTIAELKHLLAYLKASDQESLRVYNEVRCGYANAIIELERARRGPSAYATGSYDNLSHLYKNMASAYSHAQMEIAALTAEIKKRDQALALARRPSDPTQEPPRKRRSITETNVQQSVWGNAATQDGLREPPPQVGHQHPRAQFGHQVYYPPQENQVNVPPHRASHNLSAPHPVQQVSSANVQSLGEAPGRQGVPAPPYSQPISSNHPNHTLRVNTHLPALPNTPGQTSESSITPQSASLTQKPQPIHDTRTPVSSMRPPVGTPLQEGSFAYHQKQLPTSVSAPNQPMMNKKDQQQRSFSQPMMTAPGGPLHQGATYRRSPINTVSSQKSTHSPLDPQRVVPSQGSSVQPFAHLYAYSHGLNQTVSTASKSGPVPSAVISQPQMPHVDQQTQAGETPVEINHSDENLVDAKIERKPLEESCRVSPKADGGDMLVDGPTYASEIKEEPQKMELPSTVPRQAFSPEVSLQQAEEPVHVEPQSAQQTDSHPPVQQAVDRAEDSDEEDDIIEVGADGLRLPEQCVGYFLLDNDKDPNRKMCMICSARYERDLTKQPPKWFENYSVDDLIKHFSTDHPAAWEKMRQPVGFS